MKIDKKWRRKCLFHGQKISTYMPKLIKLQEHFFILFIHSIGSIVSFDCLCMFKHDVMYISSQKKLSFLYLAKDIPKRLFLYLYIFLRLSSPNFPHSTLSSLPNTLNTLS